MELEIVTRRDNPLLKRTEVRFRVSHPKEQSPPRGALREQLAKALHATRDIVIVDFSRSEFGRATSHGYAKVYKSKEDALRAERKHTLVRNGLLEAEKKEAKPKEARAPPPKKEEAPKPAEKAPAPPREEKPAAKEEKKSEPKPTPEKKPPGERKEAKHPPEKKEEKKPEGKKGGKEGK